MEILRKEGLGGFDDHPDKILGYAIAEQVKKDDGFRTKTEEFDQLTGLLIEKIYEQSPDLEQVLEEYGKM